MLTAILCSGAIAISFVAVIYVGSDSNEVRNNPSVIRRRCAGVLLFTSAVPLFVYAVHDRQTFGNVPFLHVLGLRCEGLAAACVVPLAITGLLFLGPLFVHLYVDGHMWLLIDVRGVWLANVGDLLWLRDLVFAPLAEEVCFRACVLALLFPALGGRRAALLGSVLFGCCHLHHLKERSRRSGFKRALLMTSLQWAYTTLFGVYASLLFLRTGHVLSCVLVHSFCNYMGVPQFPPSPAGFFPFFKFRSNSILSGARGGGGDGSICGWDKFLWLLYVCGFLGWVVMLGPATRPQLYGNTIYSLDML